MVTQFRINYQHKRVNPSTIDISDHPFIKYDIFEVTINFPPIDTTIDIIAQ